MEVFSKEYVQRVKSRYENNREYERPELYFIAVSELAQGFRDEIEEMFASLSTDEQKCAITRLQSIENFTQTYNELAVGCMLKKLGYKVEYDKTIDGLTPDWYVHSQGNKTAFIIEVFTTKYYGNDKLREDLQVKNLEGRLGKITFDAVLTIRLDDHTTLNPGRNKRIVKEIEQWLTQEAPPTGAQYSGDGFTCDVERTSCYSNVYPVVVRKGTVVDPKRLKNTIEDKTKKYQCLEVPIVVGVVTDPILGGHLRSVLLGTKSARFSSNKLTGERITEYIQSNDGLFGEKPDLSAVLWISRPSGGWKMTAIYNPTAMKPLPGDTFGETHCSLSPLGD
jgi:hypothetical protein